jgi:putative transposase
MKKPRGPQPDPLVITEAQRAALWQITRRNQSPQALVTRARIILLAAEGARNQHIADELGLHGQTVSYWRGRWLEAAEALAHAETDEKRLAEVLHEALSDRRRSGAPVTFTAEQVCQIVALSCERPEASDRPVTHWTPKELAQEAQRRRIVETISPRSVGRFLKRSRDQATSGEVLADQ